MNNVRTFGLAIAAAFTAAFAPGAVAQTPTELTSGAAQLPASALVVDLPARAGLKYHVSGSWSLDSDGIFDGRDVIDEINVATGNVATGNWVMSGYFNAGGCAETLASGNVDTDWKDSLSLWGQSWSVRGGVFTFAGSLGRRPVAMLCREVADGPTLLLYHFLANQPETTAKDAVLASVRGSATLASVSAAFTSRRTNDIVPLRRSDVRNRGTNPAARTVKLEASGLEVALPDDGYLWLTSSSDGVDFLDRLLPTFPEVTLETVLAPSMTCDQVLGSVPGERLPDHRATGAPSGWISGAALLVDDTTELVLCHNLDDAAILAGVFQGKDKRDVTYLGPLLGALLAAARQ